MLEMARESPPTVIANITGTPPHSHCHEGQTRDCYHRPSQYECGTAMTMIIKPWLLLALTIASLSVITVAAAIDYGGVDIPVSSSLLCGSLRPRDNTNGVSPTEVTICLPIDTYRHNALLRRLMMSTYFYSVSNNTISHVRTMEGQYITDFHTVDDSNCHRRYQTPSYCGHRDHNDTPHSCASSPSNPTPTATPSRKTIASSPPPPGPTSTPASPPRKSPPCPPLPNCTHPTP